MALDDLIRYESAAVAAVNVKKDSELAIASMSNFYRGILKEDDPIISKALQEAMSGGEAGISNLGVVQAIGVYGGKYENAFQSTKFSELVKYLTDGYNISNEAKEALGKYNEMTLVDLSKNAKDEKTSKEEKEAFQKAFIALNALKERKLRAASLSIIGENTSELLSQLYPKEEKKE